MASIHVVIVPIIPKPEAREAIETAARAVAVSLGTDMGIHVDTRDMRHGEKYFEWEKKGVPIRIEIGPKDIENNAVVLVRRDTGDKEVVAMSVLQAKVAETLAAIQQNLFDRASALRNQNTVNADSWDGLMSGMVFSLNEFFSSLTIIRRGGVWESPLPPPLPRAGEGNHFEEKKDARKLLYSSSVIPRFNWRARW
jgi:hypothetical protein